MCSELFVSTNHVNSSACNSSFVPRHITPSETCIFSDKLIFSQMTTLNPTESSRRWTFTLNNYTEEEEISLQELPGCTYMVYGRETGSNGTPHLQGFIISKVMKRFSAMKKINDRAHWETAKSISRINREYCLKGSQSKAEWDESIENFRIQLRSRCRFL